MDLVNCKALSAPFMGTELANGGLNGFSSLQLFPEILEGIESFGLRNPTELQLQCIPLLNSGLDSCILGPRGAGKITAAVISAFENLLRVESGSSGAVHCKVCFIVPDTDLVDHVNRLLSAISQYVTRIPRDVDDRLRCVITDTSQGFERVLRDSPAGMISDDIVSIIVYRPEMMDGDISPIFQHCSGRPQIVVISEDMECPKILNMIPRQFHLISSDQTYGTLSSVTTNHPRPLPRLGTGSTMPYNTTSSMAHPTHDVGGYESNSDAMALKPNVSPGPFIPELPMRSCSTQSAGMEPMLADKDTDEQLKSINDRVQQIKLEYCAAWDELKKQYLEKLQPYLSQRRETINELTDGKLMEYLPSTLGDGALHRMPVATQKLPGFWFHALMNHPLLEEVIEPHDEGPLRYLEDITVEWDLYPSPQVPLIHQKQKSFSLHFHFVENPYFCNKFLTKKFIMQRNYLKGSFWNDNGEDVLIATLGCDIAWRNDQCLVSKMIMRKQRNRKTNETRQIREAVPQNSFFNFFHSHSVPTNASLGLLSRSDLEDIDVVLEAEFEVGLIIRDKLIPNALGWYLGYSRDSEFEESSYGSDYD